MFGNSELFVTHCVIIHCMFMMLREILTRVSAEFKERGLIVARHTMGQKYFYILHKSGIMARFQNFVH